MGISLESRQYFGENFGIEDLTADRGSSRQVLTEAAAYHHVVLHPLPVLNLALSIGADPCFLVVARITSRAKVSAFLLFAKNAIATNLPLVVGHHVAQDLLAFH